MRQPVLAKALTHIAFDIYHYQCYEALWKNPLLRSRSKAAYQATLYALLLELRLLLVFFYRRSRYDDDCNLDRFDILPGFMDRFGGVHRRRQAEKIIENLNKRLAHITARRWRVRAPIMDYYTIFGPELNRLITQFEHALPKGLKQRYVEAKQHWATSHPPVIS